jgi:hypothetical protein
MKIKKITYFLYKHISFKLFYCDKINNMNFIYLLIKIINFPLIE